MVGSRLRTIVPTPVEAETYESRWKSYASKPKKCVACGGDVLRFHDHLAITAGADARFNGGFDNGWVCETCGHAHKRKLNQKDKNTLRSHVALALGVPELSGLWSIIDISADGVVETLVNRDPQRRAVAKKRLEDRGFLAVENQGGFIVRRASGSAVRTILANLDQKFEGVVTIHSASLTTDPAARVGSPAFSGIEIEVDLMNRLPRMVFVGISAQQAQLATEVLRASIVSAFDDDAFPRKRIIINLRPADLRKTWPENLRLPMAVGLLAAGGTLDRRGLDSSIFVGAVRNDGSVFYDEDPTLARAFMKDLFLVAKSRRLRPCVPVEAAAVLPDWSAGAVRPMFIQHLRELPSLLARHLSEPWP